VCFCTRMVFDSVLRDHLLEIFLFITGLLSTRVFVMGAGPALILKTGKCRDANSAEYKQSMKAV